MPFSAEAATLNSRIATDDAAIATATTALASARAAVAAAVATWAHLWAGVPRVEVTSRGTPFSSEAIQNPDLRWVAPSTAGDIDAQRATAWAAVESAEAVLQTALVNYNSPLFDREVANMRLGQLSLSDRNGTQWP